MGYSRWNDAAFDARQKYRKTTNTTAFTYDKQVRASGIVAVHDQMNPFGVIRESRDSVQHPDSVAIGVIFDVTGSMGSIPRVMQTKLGALMRTLVQRGVLAHPQVLFGAVGDAYTDRVPLQIGQFESGLEMDDDLGKIYIEGGGGGQVHESYELALYFFAHHTAIDCYEKRGHKGYLFTIGDEKPYAAVNARQVRDVIGDEVQRDVPLARVVEALQRRYEYFHIIPTDAYHGRSDDVQEAWRDLIGERALLLDDAKAVCETIALAIGLVEGTLFDLEDGVANLTSAGYDAQTVNHAARSLAALSATRTPVVSGTIR